MKSNSGLIRGVAYGIGVVFACLAVGGVLYNALASDIKALPLPSLAVISAALFVLAAGTALLAALKKNTLGFKEAAGENGSKIAEKIILTVMLLAGAFLPLYYAWFWWAPNLIQSLSLFPTLGRRDILLALSIIFVPAIGACYYLVYTIWPNVGRISWGLFLSSVVVVLFIIVSATQQPVKLFDLQGNSVIYYNQRDFVPYYLKGASGQKFYDERDGTELVRLTRLTPPEVVAKIGEAAAKKGLIGGFANLLGLQSEKKPAPPDPKAVACGPKRPVLIDAEPLEFGKVGEEKPNRTNSAPGDILELTVESGKLALLINNQEVEHLPRGTYKTSSHGGVQVFRAKAPNTRAHLKVWRP